MAEKDIKFLPIVASDIKELKINQIEFSQLREKIIESLKDIEYMTSRLRGMPTQFRKIKWGDKRIVLCVSKNTVYVIKIFHRRQGYGEKSLKNFLNKSEIIQGKQIRRN